MFTVVRRTGRLRASRPHSGAPRRAAGRRARAARTRVRGHGQPRPLRDAPRPRPTSAPGRRAEVPDPDEIELGVAGERITTTVDVTAFLDRKRAAMAAHALADRRPTPSSSPCPTTRSAPRSAPSGSCGSTPPSDMPGDLDLLSRVGRYAAAWLLATEPRAPVRQRTVRRPWRVRRHHEAREARRARCRSSRANPGSRFHASSRSSRTGSPAATSWSHASRNSSLVMLIGSS